MIDHMRLSVLGSAGSYGAPGQACSSYLVQEGDGAILLDCGNGSFSNLLRFADPGELDAVFISHSHHDHLVDLVSLYHYLLFVPGALRHRLKLFLSAPTLEALNRIFPVELGVVFEVIEVDAGGFADLGSMSLAFGAAIHMSGSLSIRIASGSKSLVYGGDGAASPELELFCARTDLLVAEATWISRPPLAPSGLHMDAAMLAEMARACQPKTLLVTHVAFPATSSEAATTIRQAYAGVVIGARDAMTIVI